MSYSRNYNDEQDFNLTFSITSVETVNNNIKTEIISDYPDGYKIIHTITAIEGSTIATVGSEFILYFFFSATEKNILWAGNESSQLPPQNVYNKQ